MLYLNKNSIISRDHIRMRLEDMAENLWDMEQKRELQRICKKLSLQVDCAYEATDIDEEINMRLEKMPQYISSKSKGVINNYLAFLDENIIHRGNRTRGGHSMGTIAKLKAIFTNKKQVVSNQLTEDILSDRAMFEWENEMLGECDVIDSLVKSMEGHIHDAARLKQGDPREKFFAVKIKQCRDQIQIAEQNIDRIAAILDIETRSRRTQRERALYERYKSIRTSVEKIEVATEKALEERESFNIYVESATEILSELDKDARQPYINTDDILSEINNARVALENTSDQALTFGAGESLQLQESELQNQNIQGGEKNETV